MKKAVNAVAVNIKLIDYNMIKFIITFIMVVFLSSCSDCVRVDEDFVKKNNIINSVLPLKYSSLSGYCDLDTGHTVITFKCVLSRPENVFNEVRNNAVQNGWKVTKEELSQISFYKRIGYYTRNLKIEIIGDKKYRIVFR